MTKLSQIAQATSPPQTTDFLVGVTSGNVDQLFSGLQIGAIPRGINTQTSNYTLVLTDAGKIVEMNVASANTLTIPTNASVAFPVGTVIPVTQVGAGTTTITAAGGVTLDTANAAMSQWVEGTLYKRGTNEWVFSQGGSGGGGGGSPGGSNTDIQFNNSSAFGGDSGFTYAGSGQATLALGTITANAKALNITGTWNNGSVTFDAPLFMNITDMASAGGSLLVDLQKGGSTYFSISRLGNISLPNGSNISIGAGVLGYGYDYGGTWEFVSGSNATVGPNNAWAWGNHTFLFSQGADIIAQSDGTNANAFRVYNTADSNTSPTNYERGVFDFTTTSNVLTIGTQAGGTGTARDIYFSAASGKYTFGAPGSSVTPTNNGDLCIQATTNTSLTFKYKGSDGTVRSASLTLS